MNIKNLRYSARTGLGRHRWGYEILRRLPGFSRKCVSDNTQCVIEGFPRSGNSFFLYLFSAWNPHIRIAHHCHVPQQIIQGVDRSIPCLVLIRPPLAAVASLLIIDQSLSVDLALKSYASFYSDLRPFRSRFIVSRFEEAIKTPDVVVERLNKKFQTSYACFSVSPSDENAAFEQLARHNQRERQPEHLVAAPNNRKERLKQAVNEKILRSRYFVCAEQEFEHFSTFSSKIE